MMIVTKTMRIAIEVAMISMIVIVVRMTMVIAIKVAMTLMITMVQWQHGSGRGSQWIVSLNRAWQTSQNRPIFAFRFNFVSNQL